MQYRHLHNTGDATSYKNLVNFVPAIPKITFLICLPSYGYWAIIVLRPPFVALAFLNALMIEMSIGAFKAATVHVHLI